MYERCQVMRGMRYELRRAGGAAALMRDSRPTANDAATTASWVTSSPSSIIAGTPSWNTATRSHRPTSSSVSDE